MDMRYSFEERAVTGRNIHLGLLILEINCLEQVLLYIYIYIYIYICIYIYDVAFEEGFHRL
jgi:hypothetical protein